MPNPGLLLSVRPLARSFIANVALTQYVRFIERQKGLAFRRRLATLFEDQLECACFTWSYGEEESSFGLTISSLAAELRACWLGNWQSFAVETGVFFAQSAEELQRIGDVFATRQHGAGFEDARSHQSAPLRVATFGLEGWSFT